MANHLQQENEIKLGELYKQIFEEYRFASNYRLKIIIGWLALYAALATAFSWLSTNQERFIWVLPLVAIIVTILMWLADIRNRPAIRRSKEVGDNIEKEAGLPYNLRFFGGLERGISHSKIIDLFAITALIAFYLAFLYLINQPTTTAALISWLFVGLSTLSLIILLIAMWFVLKTKKNNTKAKTEMPLPFVMGGIGLFLAYIFNVGISGWQGFLIGFAAGFIIPAIITLSSSKSRVSQKETGK